MARAKHCSRPSACPSETRTLGEPLRGQDLAHCKVAQETAFRGSGLHALPPLRPLAWVSQEVRNVSYLLPSARPGWGNPRRRQGKLVGRPSDLQETAKGLLR